MSNLTFELLVESHDPLAIAEIVSYKYEMLADAAHRVSCRVPPGLYIVRAKYRNSVVEKVVKVDAQDLRVDLVEQDFSSNRTGSETRRSDLSIEAHNSRAGPKLSSWITVAISDWGDAGSNLPGGRTISPSDFGICNIYGVKRRDFDKWLPEKAPLDSRGMPIGGEVASVAVGPGWHALAMPGIRGSRVLVPLFVSASYSPTVFVRNAREGSETRLEFDDLLISYDNSDQYAPPDPLRLKAVDTAQRSLELGRYILAESVMRVLLDQKFKDPMLGLLALQLLLLQGRAENSDTFNEVMGNMVKAFGCSNHPDLVIARAQARKRKWVVAPMEGDDDFLVAPPLLRSSWNQMLLMPDRKKEMSRKSSPLFAIGQALLPAGVWLVWKPNEKQQKSVFPEVDAPGGWHSDYFHHNIMSASSASRSSRTFPNQKEQPGDPPPRVARPSSAPDAVLSRSVEAMRSKLYLQQNMREELEEAPARGTVMDRTVARTLLQLASFESTIIGGVPKGYSKELAQNLSVPLAVLVDSVARVGKGIAKKAESGPDSDVPILK